MSSRLDDTFVPAAGEVTRVSAAQVRKFCGTGLVEQNFLRPFSPNLEALSDLSVSAPGAGLMFQSRPREPSLEGLGACARGVAAWVMLAPRSNAEYTDTWI